MILETARPPEASHFDSSYALPDARTLSSLLSLRCEKDDAEELMEMYRLVCSKLSGERCAWCSGTLDESSSAGLFDGHTLAIPSTVPKVLVPQCGHPIHTLCFGSQLLPDQRCGGMRGHCRRCGYSYAWSSIDVDPIVSAFCLLFGSYVDKRASEMHAEGEIFRSAIDSMVEICHGFSQELCGLVAPASAWTMLVKRHAFECHPDAINVINECVLNILAPLEDPELCSEVPKEPQGPLVHTAVVGPEDRHDSDEALSDASSGLIEERKHLTEVFLPDEDAASDLETECAEHIQAGNGEGLSPVDSPIDDLPPLSLPPAAISE